MKNGKVNINLRSKTKEAMYSTTRDEETGSILYYKVGDGLVATLDSELAIKSKDPDIKTIDDLLKFDLQQGKAITGLYPEEVIAKAYHNSQDSSKIAILDNISDLDTLDNTGGSDFMVAPIYKNGHFISAIVHFINPEENSGKDREIFVFDSQQENDISYIGTSDELKEEPELLNRINLQGNSGTCGYFTAEFLAKASEFNEFQNLQKYCINNNQMQNYVYNQVGSILKSNGKDLNKLRGSLTRIGSGTGYGKVSSNKFDSLNQTPIKQSKSQSLPARNSKESHYWRDIVEGNRIKRSKLTPNISK